MPTTARLAWRLILALASLCFMVAAVVISFRDNYHLAYDLVLLAFIAQGVNLTVLHRAR